MSVVTEETSAENSDKNSLHSPLSPNKEVINQWESLPPDVSYPSPPVGINGRLLNDESNVVQQPKGILTKNSFPVTPPKHFFSPLKPNHNFDTVPNRVTSFSTPERSTNLQNLNIIPEKYPQSEIVPITPFGTPKPRPKLNLEPYIETSPDIVIQSNQEYLPRDSFINGGNLDELLQDIETISNDILNISNQNVSGGNQEITQASILELDQEDDDTDGVKPFKTELNVVLLPKPMPLIGFDKYQNIKSSMDSLDTFKKSTETLHFCDNTTLPMPDSMNTATVSNLTRQNSNPFFDNFDPNQDYNYFSDRYNLGFKKDLYNYNSCHNSSTSLLGHNNKPTKLLEKNEMEEKQQCSNENNDKEEKKVEESTTGKDDKNVINSKSKRTRKVSIYFKGKKDKIARTFSLDPSKLLSSSKHHNNQGETSKLESFEKAHHSNKQSESNDPTTITPSNTNHINTSTNPTEHDTKKDSDNKNSSDSKASNYSKHRKSSSTSPERKHLHVKLEEDANKKKGHKKRHKKSERRLPNRKNSLGAEKFREQRSLSICTDKSNILDHKFGNNYDDFYTTSERDRSHSLSSCETINSRKMSHVPTLAVVGKIPWFGCWGNGCL